MKRQTFDFLNQQKQSKKFSFYFAIGFALTVLLTICLIYFATALILVNFPYQLDLTTSLFGKPPKYWNTNTFLGFFIVIGVTISFVSFTKLFQLQADGGYSLIYSLGAEAIDPLTSDINEKRFLNIVEEMAVASGLPSPDTLIMRKENSINAFATGFSPQTAMITITQGALDYLSRDELQGVVAHEFSHILNNDIKFNLQLFGWLHGLLFVSNSGLALLGSLKKTNGRGLIVIITAGTIIYAIGSAGRFTGQLLQATISRQRELLADAFAAQFTRNPQSLAQALIKIGAPTNSNTIANSKVSGASHIFFSSPIKSLFKSHPPLEMRIRALDPTWEGQYIVPTLNKHAQLKDKQQKQVELKMAFLNKQTIPFNPNVYNLLPWQTLNIAVFTEIILKEMPADLISPEKNYHELKIIIGLILFDDKHAELQKPILKKYLSQKDHKKIIKWNIHLKQQDYNLRLPLLDLLSLDLKKLATEEKNEILLFAKEMSHIDSKLTLFEVTTLKILENYLFEDLNQKQDVLVDIKFFEFKEAMETIFSILAWLGHPQDPNLANKVYRFSLTSFKNTVGAGGVLPIHDIAQVDLITKQLSILAKTFKQKKKIILQAAIRCATFDNILTYGEYELIRALAAYLNLPLANK